MPKDDPAKLKRVSLSLPFGIGGVEWEADPTERRAAWSLYVELITRVAVQSLETDQGTMREALNSLYSMFAITRQVLKEAGPAVGASRSSVGGIAIAVLNKGLRPFLSKWHPMLQAWEVQRSVGVSPQNHEKCWEQEPQLRQELARLSQELEQYADALAIVIGIEDA